MNTTTNPFTAVGPRRQDRAMKRFVVAFAFLAALATAVEAHARELGRAAGNRIALVHV
jgi:hypothetical protein